MEPSFILAFSTGFLGGMGHCIGMCGPLVASFAFHSATSAGNVKQHLLPHLLYNAGRITTYIFTGAVMGATGFYINNVSGLQNIVAIAAGLIMILMGISISGIFGGVSWLEKHNNLILRGGKGLLKGGSLLRYYPLGLLFGFMPCGLSYTAFTAAAGTGSLFSGMTLMLFFGLGTFPALLLFGFTASSISARLRGLLYRSAGIMVIVMGILFIYRKI